MALFSTQANWSGNQGPDNRTHALTAWHLVNNGTFHIPADEYLNEDGDEIRPYLLSAYYDGEGVLSQYGPGVPLVLAAPMYLSGVGLDECVQAQDNLVDTVGDQCIGQPPTWPGSLVAVLMTAASVVFIAATLRTRHPDWIAYTVAVLYGAGTSIFAIASGEMWVHTVDVFVITLGLLLAAKKNWIGSGFAFGYLALVRPHVMIIGTVTAIAESWKQRSVIPALKFGAPASLGVAALVWYNKAMYNTWGIVGGYKVDYVGNLGAGAVEDSNGFIPNTLKGLLQYPEGLVISSLFALITLFVFPALWKKSDVLTKGAYVGGILYLAVQYKLHRAIPGSGIYGWRYTTEMVAALPLATAMLVAWVADQSETIKKASIIVTALSLSLTIGMTVI